MDKVKQLRINSKAEVRSDEDQKYLIGYAAVFNERAHLGYFHESIAPGAFTRALERKDDTRVLFNHNPDLIIARSVGGSLQMEEDEKGLLCRIALPDTTLGNDLRVLIQDGIISQMSFGFYIDEEEKRGMEGGKPWFEIRSVTLFDIAPVTYPVYERTSIQVEKSIEERASRIQKEEESRVNLFEYRQRKNALRKKRDYIST